MSKKEKRLYYTTMDSVWVPELNMHAMRGDTGSHTTLPCDTPFSKYGCDYAGAGRLESRMHTYHLEEYFRLLKNKYIQGDYTQS